METGLTTGICELTLETRNTETLSEFYKSLFDWPELSREDGRVWLGCSQFTRLGLWSPGPKEFGDRGGQHVHFALSVDPDCLDRLADRLRSRNIDYRGPVQHEGGDRSVYFEDLEGNVVEVWDFFERGRGLEAGVTALSK